ncbi:abscisic acid-deficient protein Aba4 family protein, partial [Escherichia coli]|uniref:abscisic acid-deficient protein Aba4 family protein n=1 Tax=Escherichia coli TaxID=562 RepID=UPI0028DE2BFB
AVAYVGSLATGLAARGGGGFGSIAEVRQLFANDASLTAGWIHYLAFDLMVGTLIARDAVRAGVPAVFTLPALVLTFLFGPA